jgi:hypothetical protein
MDSHTKVLIALAAALVVSNYLYQSITGMHDWGAAFERSYFQLWALLLAWVATRGT